MRIPCPQCGGEVHLQEAGGFPACPFCGTRLYLDLCGVRPHLLYLPRHAAVNIPPLLRRWCDHQGLPPPSILSAPHLRYLPFWRYIQEGSPRLVPAWPTLESRWAAVQIPEGEQLFFDPALVERAEVVESGVAEEAARRRLRAGGAAKPGELVHVPFFEITMQIGNTRVGVSVEACSGRIYSSLMPESILAERVSGPGRPVTMGVGFAVMLAGAVLSPSAWLAAAVLGLTGAVLYWILMSDVR